MAADRYRQQYAVDRVNDAVVGAQIAGENHQARIAHLGGIVFEAQPVRVKGRIMKQRVDRIRQDDVLDHLRRRRHVVQQNVLQPRDRIAAQLG